MHLHITLDVRTLIIVALLSMLATREGLPLDVLTLAFVRVRRELSGRDDDDTNDPPRLPPG